MATDNIKRTDDTSAVLQQIATVSATEDAATKHWQGVVVADGSDPAGAGKKMAVDASSHAQVDIAAASVTVPVSLTSTTITGTVAVTQSGTWDEVGINDSGNSITVDGTVSISGTVAVTQSGTWDEVGINDSGNSITVDGTVAATQSGTWNVTDISGIVSLPTGASTLAEQQTQTTHLATIAGDTTDIEAAVEIMDDWDESDRAKVNVIVGQAGIAAGTGVDGVTVPRVSLATNVALPAGTNNIGDVDILTIAAGDNNIGNVDIVTLPAIPAGTNNIGDVDVLTIAAGDNNIGNVDVVTLPALAAGTNNIGDVDVLTIAAGANLIADVGIQPRTTNGLTTFMASGSDSSTALTSTAQVVKASAGKLYGYYIYNPNATAQFVHLYNTAAASVTVGTTAPLFTLTIPALSAANLMNDIGITFSNAGWSISATATAGGNGAPTTALDAVIWYA